jgi:hypothetical protein
MMANKKIGSDVAANLMDAFYHLAKLEDKMQDIKWRLCYRDDVTVIFGDAKLHCRKLLKELDNAEHWHYTHKEEEEEKEDKQPTIRQVK